MKIEVEVQSESLVMTEDEFRQWLDMFMADKSLGCEFRVRRTR